MFFYILGMILALAAGIYIGLGLPGLPGPRDRVVWNGRRRQRRRTFMPLDWLRPPKL